MQPGMLEVGKNVEETTALLAIHEDLMHRLKVLPSVLLAANSILLILPVMNFVLFMLKKYHIFVTFNSWIRDRKPAPCYCPLDQF